MATRLEPHYLSAEEFLAIDFTSEEKAELDNGIIRMMAGGTRAHDRVQTNLIIALGNTLRGSGCRPSGSDMAVKRTDNRFGIRTSASAAVSMLPKMAESGLIENPRVIIEVLSPSTATEDRSVKFAEYRARANVEVIVLVDPEQETFITYERSGTGPRGWRDMSHPDRLALPNFKITIGRADIFARD